MDKSGSMIHLRGEAASDFVRSFGVKLGKDRNWPEDTEQYTCICVDCRQQFCGYKRRIVCRECVSARELAHAEQEKQE